VSRARLQLAPKKKTTPPQRGESQVHPTARSKLLCHPNINTNRFWFTPKVPSCTILKKHSLNSAHGTFPQAVQPGHKASKTTKAAPGSKFKSKPLPILPPPMPVSEHDSTARGKKNQSSNFVDFRPKFLSQLFDFLVRLISRIWQM
jgi:hypothetical protein